MYLQNIIKKDEKEMIKKIYETQKGNPSPGDFSEMIKDDSRYINLNLTENEISKLSKQKFKAIVKDKVRNAAFEYLKMLKNGHSKMKNLIYEKLELQPYLIEPIFNEESRNLLLRLRTRTVNGIKADFKGIYSEISCPLGCEEKNTLENI